MGDRTSSKTTFQSAKAAYVPPSGPATAAAEEKARSTGKLDPLVDPAGFGGIRRSLVRFKPLADGRYEVTVGFPVPVETWLDTTGSMGNNVDRGIEVMPHIYDCVSEMLPGCDLQLATGIFGDVEDETFVACRPQFEMEAAKIIQQLTLMVPERDGHGNGKEDPQYGMFASAYLTAAYAHRIGLKSYCFVVTDEPVGMDISMSQLVRIFGDQVIERVRANGHEINPKRLPDTEQIVKQLLKTSHFFMLQINDRDDTNRCWPNLIGRNRIVKLPSIDYLPQVEAVIIGLTEGTLQLAEVRGYLRKHEVSGNDAELIARSVAMIPIGAQADLPNFSRRPKKGDIFAAKTDLWPVGDDEGEADDGDEAEAQAQADADGGSKPRRKSKKSGSSGGGSGSWL